MLKKGIRKNDITQQQRFERLHFVTVVKAKYLMLDETPQLVGVTDENDARKYKTKYVWAVRANVEKMVWFVYEKGSRGLEAIQDLMERFVGFFTTDGYVVYKVINDSDQFNCQRSACMTHIRRPFVDALEENRIEAKWFIDEMGKSFGIEYECKLRGLSNEERLVERLKKGSTKAIMEGIRTRLEKYRDNNYLGLGDLMKKAVKYALNEWPAMESVLKDGSIELSNNLSEQMMRHIKMNLKTATNIGSEESAKDNAFMFSLLESCRMNLLRPEAYIRHLLSKLSDDRFDSVKLLPCNCSL